MFFAVADISVNPLFPLAVGLAVSVLCAPAGVSGGFLILPFELNILNFSSLAVSPTNLLYNIISMPAGLWRLQREKRLLWPLGLLIALAGLPGIVAGTAVRGLYLSRPEDFKIFVALVLSFLALSLLVNLFRKTPSEAARAEAAFLKNSGSKSLRFRRRGLWLLYSFGGRHFRLYLVYLVILASLVGLVGGIYGIGGGAIIAPVLIALFDMPVYVAAGASLLASWGAAVMGLASYLFFWPWLSGSSPVGPDFPLGLLFGLGGALGVYLGSLWQRLLPARPIKAVLALLISLMAVENFGLF